MIAAHSQFKYNLVFYQPRSGMVLGWPLFFSMGPFTPISPLGPFNHPSSFLLQLVFVKRSFTYFLQKKTTPYPLNGILDLEPMDFLEF